MDVRTALVYAYTRSHAFARVHWYRGHVCCPALAWGPLSRQVWDVVYGPDGPDKDAVTAALEVMRACPSMRCRASLKSVLAGCLRACWVLVCLLGA